MFKAIFFDVDGTLLNRQSKIEESTQEVIRAAQEQGILCGIATGRGPTSINELVEGYGLDFAITYNGQYIYLANGTVISSSPFDKATIRRIAQYADAHDREILFGGSDFLAGSKLLRVGHSKLVRYLSPILPAKMSNSLKNSFQHIVRKYKKSDYSNYPALRKPIYQVVLISPEKEQELLAEVFPTCSITRSNPYSVDMIPRGGSKLRGIQIFCAHFGIDLTETMAFGDSWNDLEMLKGVGAGVAMGNGVTAAKEVADFVTTSNDRDGIARAFQQFGITQDISVGELSMKDMFVETMDGVDNLIQPNPSKTKQKEETRLRSKDEKFNQVKRFHETFDKTTQETPMAFDTQTAAHRAGFVVEELVEFLHATSNNNPETFAQLLNDLHQDIDNATEKITSNQKQTANVLVEQVDALTDMLYFTYGSFVLMGVDPHAIFNHVHNANMAKLWPDGTAHYDAKTNKILKPEGWEENHAPEKKILREIEKQMNKGKQ